MIKTWKVWHPGRENASSQLSLSKVNARSWASVTFTWGFHPLVVLIDFSLKKWGESPKPPSAPANTVQFKVMLWMMTPCSMQRTLSTLSRYEQYIFMLKRVLSVLFYHVPAYIFRILFISILNIFYYLMSHWIFIYSNVLITLSRGLF